MWVPDLLQSYTLFCSDARPFIFSIFAYAKWLRCENAYFCPYIWRDNFCNPFRSLKIEYQRTFLPSLCCTVRYKLQERVKHSRLWRCDSNSQRKRWQAEALMILAFSHRSSVEAVTEPWAVATYENALYEQRGGETPMRSNAWPEFAFPWLGDVVDKYELTN